MIADSTMDIDSLDEHHNLHREPDSISTVILPGKWPKKLTGSHFDWSSQSAKARAKERGNPNRRHSRFRGRAFPALNKGKPSDAISSYFAASDYAMMILTQMTNSGDADETMIDWCSEPLLF